MNWKYITTKEAVDEAANASFERPACILKHSTRCGISSMALSRLERETAPDNIDFYFLDLIAHRDVSRYIADKFGVHHESPQVLLIKNGECVYDESHSGIRMDEIVEQAGV